MFIAAAKAIADIIQTNDLRPGYIIPTALDNRIPIAVAQAVIYILIL